MKFRPITVLSACFMAVAQIAVAAPAMEPVTYPLITNSSMSGQPVGVTGGSYVLQLSGTFGGTTIGLSVTTNGVTSSYGTWTSAPGSAPCFAIPTSSVVLATLSGGTPSNITATLGGVGSGGCSGGGGGGGGDASAANQTAVQANAGSDATKVVAVQGITGGKAVKTDGSATTQPISASALPLPAGAATAANQATANAGIGAPASTVCSTSTGSCDLTALLKKLNTLIEALTSQSATPVPAGTADIGETSPTTRALTSGVTASMTATTSTQLFAAPGGVLKNYLGTLVCYNTHASVDTGVDILDGSGGTVIGSVPAGKVYGGSVVRFSPMLAQPTANTALHVVNKTTGAAVTCTGAGVKR